MPERPPGVQADSVLGSEETRRLAARLAADLPALAPEIFDFVATQLDQVNADEETRELTMAACVSTVEAGLWMLAHGVPAERAHAPVAALEHARHMAARGEGINATLRFYRLGHAYFWERWAEAMGAQVDDPVRLVELLRDASAFVFAFLDVISGEVSAELLAERDRRQRRVTALREDVVQAILAGEHVDVARAERTLGFGFQNPQFAFICWTDDEPGALEPAAEAVIAAVEGSQWLLISQGAAELAGWVSAPRVERPAPPVLTAAIAQAAAGVRVAVGGVASGLEGFRSSHDQARRARRVARLAARGAPSVTRFEDVALLDLLSCDLPAARAFVAVELGGLASRDERAGELREFMLLYLIAGDSHTSAAATLGVHRNTARQRLQRAEELRGRPVTQHRSELLAALVLVGALGETVLSSA
jgi:DNA-binding PucR family transcriptional regulator